MVPATSGVPEQARAQFPGFLFRDVLESHNLCRRARVPRSRLSLGSPPPPRFARVGLARAGGCPAGFRLRLPPRSGEWAGVTWGLDNASFLAFGARGSEAEDPRLPKAGRKACVGPETTPTNPGSHSTPSETPCGPFCEARALLYVGNPERPLSHQRDPRENREAGLSAGPGEARAGGRGLAGGGQTRERSEPVPSFTPRPAGERSNRNPDINF